MGYMPHPRDDGTKYGFHIGRSPEWYVDLPHQCDEWDIAYGDEVEAVAQMETFVAEAQAALARLRRAIRDESEVGEGGQQ
jgi:hypothetical protein